MSPHEHGGPIEVEEPLFDGFAPMDDAASVKQSANAPERTGPKQSTTRDRILQGAADAIGTLGYAATRVWC